MSPANPRRHLPLFDAVAAPSAATPGSLPEFHHYRPRAGHPDWPTLARAARDEAAHLRTVLAPPQSRLREAARKARSFATASEVFVENRRRARVGREDLLPLYFIWTTHRRCNFACDYCDDHQGHKYPELPPEGALNTDDGLRLLTIMRTRASSVYFAGGEPTMRRDLPVLVRAARDLNYYPIIVNTNASGLAKQLRLPSYRSFLADVDTIVVSLDGLDVDWLARTWHYPRPTDVLESLLVVRELAADMRVRLAVNTVIQPGLTQHARDVLDLACDLGLWFSPVPCNTGGTIADGLRGDPAYDALTSLILERKRAGHSIQGSLRLNERLLRSAPLVCRNTLKPHIDHDGRLFWPCKASVSEPPITARVLDFDHVDALWADCTRRKDPARFSERCGARCNWAQNYTTDAYAHGLLHPSSLASELLDFLRVS